MYYIFFIFQILRGVSFLYAFKVIFTEHIINVINIIKNHVKMTRMRINHTRNFPFSAISHKKNIVSCTGPDMSQ